MNSTAFIRGYMIKEAGIIRKMPDLMDLWESRYFKLMEQIGGNEEAWKAWKAVKHDPYIKPSNWEDVFHDLYHNTKHKKLTRPAEVKPAIVDPTETVDDILTQLRRESRMAGAEKNEAGLKNIYKADKP